MAEFDCPSFESHSHSHDVIQPHGRSLPQVEKIQAVQGRNADGTTFAKGTDELQQKNAHGDIRRQLLQQGLVQDSQGNTVLHKETDASQQNVDGSVAKTHEEMTAASADGAAAVETVEVVLQTSAHGETEIVVADVKVISDGQGHQAMQFDAAVVEQDAQGAVVDKAEFHS